MGKQTVVTLEEARTNLSSLMERAAAGEEIVIAEAGKSKVKLVTLPDVRLPRIGGQNYLAITDPTDEWWDRPLPDEVRRAFGEDV